MILPLTLLALSACATAPSNTPPETPALPASSAAPGSPLDALFDIGNGLKLHIHCTGAGSPVVVLDAGLGDDVTIWNEVQPEVSRTTRVCAYDRAGTGTSGPASKPHSSKQMARELHTLLEVASVKPPYVLAGHSLGGLNLRLFASEHLSEVAGMVLIDGTTEEQDSRSWALMPESELRTFKAFLAAHPEGIDYDTFRASMADVRASNKSLGNLPLVVLTHGLPIQVPPGSPADLGPRLTQVWRDMQSTLPSLSTNSVHITAEFADHYIHQDTPRLVIAAIQQVVLSARTHAPLDPKPIAAHAHDKPPPPAQP